MACQIQRTKDGKINKVTAPNGSRSKLFDAIHGNLFLADANTSVKIMNNAYAETIVKKFEGQDKYKYDTGEPQLFYKSPSNKVYDNLEEVLINDDFGNVTMGFMDPSTDELIPIAEFTTKGSPKNEFLHAKVREGILSADRVLMEDGSTRYQGKGAYETTKVVMAHLAANDLVSELGVGRYKMYPDGTLDIEFATGYTNVIDENGNSKPIRTETIPEHVNNNPNIQNIPDLAIEYVLTHDNPIPVTTETPKQSTQSIKDLESSLISFLESVGFSISTIDEYNNNYNTKYGEGANVNALVDISNSIVAFKNKEIDVNQLSEEVAHIAIGSYNDQNSILDILANVHLTPEYNQFAEKYRQVYGSKNKDLSPSQLEDKVRKEILGKILAKAISEKFNTYNKTPEQFTLLSKLKRIWDWFVNKINGIKPYQERYLKDLVDTIADSVLTGDNTNFKNEFDSSYDYFYSLMDNQGLTIEQELQRGRKIIEELYKSVIKEPVPNQAELDRLSESMEEHNIVSSVNAIVSNASLQMKQLISAIEDSKKSNSPISANAARIYEVLKDSMLPTIDNLIAGLEEMSNDLRSKGKLTDNLKGSIETITKAADELAVTMGRKVNPFINDAKLVWVDRILQKVLDNFSLTKEQKDEIKAKLDGGMRDIGWLGKMFGLSSHSRNLALQLMHFAVAKISSRTNEKFLPKMNQFLSKYSESELKSFQSSIINRVDGKATFHFLSPRDYHSTEVELTKRENQFIAEKTGKTIEQVEKDRLNSTLYEMLVPKDSKDESAYDEFKEFRKKNRDELYERMFDQSYYDQRDSRYDKANVSQKTRDYIAQKNVAMNHRHKSGGYINPDGTKDLSRQTEAERLADLEDKKRHALASSAYDTLGNVKDGLRVVNASELTAEDRASMPVQIDEDYKGEVTLVEKGKDVDAIPVDSRIALDLFNYNMLYRSELKDKAKTNKAVDEFLNTIKEIEANTGTAFDWVMSNASIRLSNEFYNSMGSNPMFAEIAQQYINDLEDENDQEIKQNYLDELIRLQSARKALLRQNRKPNSPIDTDAKHMMEQVREKLLDLDHDISEAKRKLGVPYELLSDFGGVEYTESALTDDYYKMLEESNLSEYEFAIKHMSEDSRGKVKSFESQLNDLMEGRRVRLRRDFAVFVKEITDSGLLDGKSEEEMSEILIDEYARKNVASYFRRFQPTGYNEMISALESGELKFSEVVSNKDAYTEKYPALKYIDVVPDYSWMKDVNNNEFVNSNYKTGDSVSQPKKLNDAFFERYGIRKEDYLALESEDLSKLTPTKNKREFEYLVDTIQIRKEVIDNYNETGRVNPYQRTQLKKENAEKWLSIGKVGTKGVLKDWARDFARSQVDEKDYGELVDGTELNVKIIPKYYQTRVEDPEFLTENSAQALLMDLKASIKYNERVEAEKDIKAIEYKIAQQKFKSNGGNKLFSRITKKGEVSNYYEKAQEMADYHLYGIRQNRKMVVDIGGKEVQLDQVFSKFTRYVRNVNLAGNLLVDVTSATTGVVNNLIDTASGDYYHKSSAAKAVRLMPGLIANYMLEEGKLNRKSDLNHILEFFGVLSPEEERLLMSAYNRGVRVASNSYFLASKYANLPVTPRNVLAILHDFKYHNGRFKSYNEFARDIRVEKGKETSNKEVTAMWNQIGETFYDNIQIKPEAGVQYNDKFLEKFDSKEEADEMFSFLHTKLMTKMSQVNQSVDAIISNEDQILAQRDALANAFMLHRSWFIINMTRKLKGNHFNLATGQYEMGHYRGILKNLYKMLKATGSRQKLSEVLEEQEMRNLRRAGVDAFITGLLIAITNMLMAGDDDDDTFVENFAQLIAMRTTSETFSQNVIGMYSTSLDLYNDPLVQSRMIEGVFKPITKVVTGEKITDKDWESMYKQILLYRRYKQYGDLQAQLDSYIYFNKSTLWGIEAAQDMEK